ncbi:MAG: WxcM-like domain-containing protein [Paludibacter sp.]|nr:WxcM-like domain-containing protein [Paludibacter sp.]
MSLASKIKIIERTRIEDSRGWFLKVITGKEENIPNYTGEIYLTNAVPNEAKGGHYHKAANEWFTLITGECELKLVDLITCEKLSIQLSASTPKTIYVPTNIAHIFMNNGTEDFILLAYTDKLYNPTDTILFSEF